MSQEKDTKKGAAKSAPSSTPSPAKSVAPQATPAPEVAVAEAPAPAAPQISDEQLARIREEEKAKLEKEMQEKYLKEQEERLAKEANQKQEQPVASSEDIGAAIDKKMEEIGSPVVEKVIKIRPSSVAKGEARVGQLLPNVKRGFGVGKDNFGIFHTGFSEKELKSFKQLPVWDYEFNRPKDEFWNNFQLMLTTSEKILNPARSEEHRIFARIAEMHPEIANSESEINSRTLFYIVDEEREAESANLELDALTQAYVYIQKMAPSERRAFLSLFGVGTKDSSDNVVTMNLRKEAEAAPQKFVKLYEDDNKADKILINEMVEFGVLQKREGAFWYNESLIGTGFSETVVWMSKPANQDIKIKLMQMLEVYKRRG